MYLVYFSTPTVGKKHKRRIPVRPIRINRRISLFFSRKYSVRTNLGFKRRINYQHHSYRNGFRSILGRQTRRAFMLGSLIALLGVALVIFNGSFVLSLSPLGDILTLTAAFMWAFYCVIFRKLSDRYSTVFITRKVFFYGVVTILPMLFIRSIPFNPAILVRPVVMMNLLFLGIIASMLCYMMWNLAVKRIGTMRASNYLYLTPLVTLFTSALIIDEPITWIAIVGCILILSGVYLTERN